MTKINQLEQSIRFAAETNGALVPFVTGGKRPVKEYVHIKQADAIVLDAIRKNNFNVGYALQTNQLDIDIDYPKDGVEPTLINIFQQCWQYFLPDTPYTFGRQSKPISHRVYLLMENFVDVKFHYNHIIQFLRHNYKIAANNIEFSPAIDFRYTKEETDNPLKMKWLVLPGSKHTTGEDIVWNSKFSEDAAPPVFNTTTVLKAIALATVASLIVPHWQKGKRQYMTMALAGMMYRYVTTSIGTVKDTDASKLIDELSNDYKLLFSLDDIQSLYDCICDVAHDEEKDARLRALQQTWDKLENDPNAPITGAPTFVKCCENGSYVVDSIFKLISGADCSINIEELRSEVFVHRRTGDVVFPKNFGTPVLWMVSRNQHANAYANIKIKHNGKSTTLTKLVYETDACRRIDAIDFRPPEKITPELYGDFVDVEPFLFQEEDELYFNTFKPFAVAPTKHLPKDPDVKPFLDYLYAMVPAEFHEYMLTFIASIFQHPGKRPITYPVLIGKPGTGKSFLWTHFIKPILGYNYVFTTADMASLEGFNSMLHGTLLVVFEEAFHSNRKAHAQKFKDFITNPTLNVRYMYRAPFEVKNFARAIVISNYADQCVYLDTNDRRAIIMHVNGEMSKLPKTYWTELYKWTQNKNNLAKLHRYFLELQLNTDILDTPVDNAAKHRIQSTTLTNYAPYVLWIVERIQENYPLFEQENWFDGFTDTDDPLDTEPKEITDGPKPWPNRVSAKAVRNDLKKWLLENGYTAFHTRGLKQQVQDVLGSQFFYLRKLAAKNGLGERVQNHIYNMPTKEEIIENLKDKYGECIVAEIRTTINEDTYKTETKTVEFNAVKRTK
jgi:hypothetical protein